ncbi:MAG: hypothetical protein OEL54_06395 [Flavobacteriaceae bacterium]|nr:hypothetical protein [Flavobacteriaceae bacterium]
MKKNEYKRNDYREINHVRSAMILTGDKKKAKELIDLIREL